MTCMLRAALSILCAAVACAVLSSGTAFAGGYVVPACSPGSSPGLWAQVNTFPAGFASGNLCGGPEIGSLDATAQGSLWAEDILGAAARIPDGARAGWTFTAPAGATITAIRYYRTLAAYASSDGAAGLFLGDGAPLEQCRIGVPFGSPLVCSMPNDQAPRVFAGLSTSSLFFGVLCDIVQPVLACVSGGTIHRVQAYMYSARVTISEDVAPSVTNVGGALWGGGVVNGKAAVTYSAADASGIRLHTVESSAGGTIASSVNRCDFMLRPPCAQSPEARLDVDTTRVSDGRQSFRLVVSDAAGNSQVLSSPPITVDNLGPPAPVGLSAAVQAGSDVIALTWSNPASPPQPVDAAMAQVCAMACSPAVAVSAGGSARLRAPGPGVYTVRVWLLDTAGRGGPHHAASTVVTVPATSPPPQPPLSAAGTSSRIGALLRGRRLRVSGPIAAAGRVTVSWRSKIDRRSVGHGSRRVTIRNRRLGVSFVIARRARPRAAVIRVVVRSGGRVVGQARARRG